MFTVWMSFNMFWNGFTQHSFTFWQILLIKFHVKKNQTFDNWYVKPAAMKCVWELAHWELGEIVCLNFFETLPRSLVGEKNEKKKHIASLTVSSKTRTWQISEKPENPTITGTFLWFCSELMVQGCLFDYMRIPNQGSINLTLTCQFFSLGAERGRERTAPQVIRLVLMSFQHLDWLYKCNISELGL
jgi:hypothetical protein